LNLFICIWVCFSICIAVEYDEDWYSKCVEYSGGASDVCFTTNLHDRYSFCFYVDIGCS